MAAIDRWKYYVSSYTMRDQTEGVPPEKMWFPFMRRNLPAMLESEEEYERLWGRPMSVQENLQMRINQENYHLQYEPFTEDWFVHDDAVRRVGVSGMKDVSAERKQNFLTKFVENPKWKADMSKEEADKTTEEAERWIKGAADPEQEKTLPQNDDAGDERAVRDEVMTGV